MATVLRQPRTRLILCYLALANVALVAAKISPPEPRELPSEHQLPLHRFGTKTAYRNVERLTPAMAPPTGASDGCSAIQLQMLLRHGSRGPSLKQVRKAEVALHRFNNAHKAEPLFAKAARAWSSPFVITGSGKSLSSVGHQEHELIGSRVARRYPHLLASHEAVAVLSSSSERSFESAKSFLHGAGLTDADIAVRLADAHIRFYDDCRRFKATIDDGPDGKREYRLFMSGPEMLQVARSTQQRLRLTDIDLTPADLSMAFSLCGMELANNLTEPASSPWCRLVEERDAHQAVEYLLDLKHYWRKSHGYNLSSLIACPLVEDLAFNLRRAARGLSDANATVLYFGHAETIFPVLARLGLFKDPGHLSHRAYASYRHGRQFRSSQLVPFAANFALTLLRCGPGASSQQLYVQLALNESPLYWTLCNDYKCPLEAALQLMQRRCPASFDFEAACDYNGGGDGPASDDNDDDDDASGFKDEL